MTAKKIELPRYLALKYNNRQRINSRKAYLKILVLITVTNPQTNVGGEVFFLVLDKTMSAMRTKTLMSSE